MNIQTTATGAGASATQKLPEERMSILKRNLRDARDMLATIERDGGQNSPLHSHYVARISGLKAKLEKLSANATEAIQ
jgi:hypothetical protein